MKEAYYEAVSMETLKPLGDSIAQILKIENARKVYKSGLCAVDAINLKMFKD